MSVLIRGMQIKDNCKECRMRTDYDFCSAMPKEFCGYTNDIRRPDWCPLVELSNKHGRLIDADAFAECIKSTIERQGYDDLTIGKFLTVGEVLNAVIDDLKGMTLYGYENTPTIIEAEDGE